MTTPFMSDPTVHPGFIAANRSRAIAAGMDPYAYDRATAAVTHIAEWPAAFLRAAAEHRRLAETAASEASAREAWLDAALAHHFATVLPDPDEERRLAAGRDAQAAVIRALDAVSVRDPHPDEGFTGYLRVPSAPSAAVVLVPGMNSSAAEFAGITGVLLRRGLAVLAVDGPGQGATPGLWQFAYERVVARAVDALAAHGLAGLRVGVWAMSMGGLLGTRAAAFEPRVEALVAVSGPSAFRFDEFVPYVADTFRQRLGGEEAARAYADAVDAAALAERITAPALVVEGAEDVIPGVDNLEVLARRASAGELLLVPDGNHLVEEHRHLWLPYAADWIAARLG